MFLLLNRGGYRQKLINKVMNMKLSTALSALTLTFALATEADARSWRINNDATKQPNFTTINAACSSDDVQNGDTLYLDPGTSLSETATISKQLTIIGCGYTGVTQPYGIATIQNLKIIVPNVKLLSLNVSSTVTIKANYATIERCRINTITNDGSNCQYANIRNCYVVHINGAGKSDYSTAFWIIENSIVFISNNYSIRNLYNATIRNNLILNSNASYYCLYNIGNSQIVNNIIIHTKTAANTLSSVDTYMLNNNVLSSETRTDYNRYAATTAAVYTGDVQDYVLIDESPAAGYGQDGQDCGIFGGLYPYVKGGRPYGHPYYESFVVSSFPVDGNINVSLKVKMQDE